MSNNYTLHIPQKDEWIYKMPSYRSDFSLNLHFGRGSAKSWANHLETYIPLLEFFHFYNEHYGPMIPVELKRYLPQNHKERDYKWDMS